MPHPLGCLHCDRAWLRDPVLEVPCPECGARVGEHCAVRRPSGHRVSPGFAGLPPWGHDSRELAAAPLMTEKNWQQQDAFHTRRADAARYLVSVLEAEQARIAPRCTQEAHP